MVQIRILRSDIAVLPMSQKSAARDAAATGRMVDSRSPFVRLNELLANETPGKPLINVVVGEPQHPVPSFVGPILADHVKDFGRYPPNAGTDRLRHAAAAWLGRRFALARLVDPTSEVLILSGTREGLFLAAIVARRFVAKQSPQPAMLMPNPFYAVYAAGAVAAGCEPVYLPAVAENGFLPGLDSLSADLLARTVAFYLASPANPQGSIADAAYLSRVVALARRHNFLIFADECYSEIYNGAPPPGMLQAAGGDFANVIVFHSLSKRSSMPGLRVGFAAGCPDFMRAFLDLRAVAAPQVPIPAQEVAVAAYEDEAHVDANRRLYRQKFDLADQIIGTRYRYRRPAGGFFLWLDVSSAGGSEMATMKLFREAGVRVLPGKYLAREAADGSNPGAAYIRVAMVHDQATTAEALHRLVGVLGS
jgi:N-succinyldiaminopimelate aminotransferase